MITCLLFILLLLAISLLIFKCHKSGVLLSFVMLMGFLLMGNGVIPSIMLKHLQDPFAIETIPVWKSNNTIILLGGGTVSAATHVEPSIIAYSRIVKTAELYLHCISHGKKCEIIISGGDAAKTKQSEAEVYQDSLIQLGVKKENIILESHSMNTYQNAEFTSELLQQHHTDQAILVTSGIHMKRSLLYFANFGVTGVPVAADYLSAPLTIIPIGYNFAMADFAIHEYAGILRLHIYNYLGWNVQSQKAGAS